MFIIRTVRMLFLFSAFGFLACESKRPGPTQVAPERDFGQMGTALMASEALGPLRLGLSEASVSSCVGASPVKGKSEQWGADGLYHQEWTDPQQGVTLGFSSGTETAPKTVCSIAVVHPCAFKTKRGIRLGSFEAETLAVYRHEYNREDSAPGESIVAGSIFGGLCFLIKDHRVSQIFLGSASE